MNYTNHSIIWNCTKPRRSRSFAYRKRRALRRMMSASRRFLNAPSNAKQMARDEFNRKFEFCGTFGKNAQVEGGA